VLLIHGDDDRDVPAYKPCFLALIQQTTDLVEKLPAQNVESLPM
jgi:hypothetical protein